MAERVERRRWCERCRAWVRPTTRDCRCARCAKYLRNAREAKQ